MGAMSGADRLDERIMQATASVGARAIDQRDWERMEASSLRALLAEVAEAWPNDTIGGQVPSLAELDDDLARRVKEALALPEAVRRELLSVLWSVTPDNPARAAISWGETFAGDVEFVLVNGWRVVVFNDCNSWDYIDSITAPDGRTWDFDGLGWLRNWSPKQEGWADYIPPA